MYEERKCNNQSLIVFYRPLAVFSRHNKNRGCRMWELKKSFPLLLLVVSLPHLPSDLKLRFHSIILWINQDLFCTLYICGGLKYVLFIISMEITLQNSLNNHVQI